MIDNGIGRRASMPLWTGPKAISTAWVIWQPKGPFSAGANLKAAAEAIQRGDYDSVRELVAGGSRRSTCACAIHRSLPWLPCVAWPWVAAWNWRCTPVAG